MCSRKELNFRQRSSEISVFEATSETVDRPPSDRQLDPTKAVKKYRRSAAGGVSKEQQYPPRSLDALYRTVEYLTDLLIHWQRTTTLPPASSFLDLVHFVEDRLRAVQVDLVISQYASKEIQYKIVQIHILTMYVLTDTSKYERRHGKKALHTALSSYWNQSTRVETDDEILALTAMMQLDEDLSRLDAHPEDYSDHTHGAGILALYRKHVDPKDTQLPQKLPRFQWVLRVISCCNTGEWSNALRLLHQECRQQENSMFGVRVACLLAPSLVRIRAKALQAYNVSLMKNEQLADAEVARLLSISHPAVAVQLCSQLHLPVGDNNEMVSFKSAPIHMEWTKRTKRDDAFVFGGQEVKAATDLNGTRIPDDTFLSTFFK